MITFEKLPNALVLMFSKFVGDMSTTFDYNGRKMWLQSFTVSENGGTLTFVNA